MPLGRWHVSRSPEADLEEFLASLPTYKRKEFEQGLSSLTQDEKNEWLSDIKANNAEKAAELWQEYVRLLQRAPAKLREYRERCIAAGMDNYISKPINVRELIELLEKFSDAAQQEASPA
jgi:hypothetical protein